MSRKSNRKPSRRSLKSMIRQAQRNRKRRNNRPLQMEVLQERALLSATVGGVLTEAAPIEDHVCEVTEPVFEYNEDTRTYTISGTHLDDDIQVDTVLGQIVVVVTDSTGMTWSDIQMDSDVDTIVLNGLCGDDTITVHDGISDVVEMNGNRGHDTLDHDGSGFAHLKGQTGNDTLLGGSAGELLEGGNGDDAILAGEGLDFALGGKGNDLIFGGTTSDVILGGDGDDRMFGLGGADLIMGNSLNEIPSPAVMPPASTPNVLLRLAAIGEGNNYIEAGDGADAVYAGVGNDLVFGGADGDTIYAMAGNDSVAGGAGDDQLHLGAGDDYATGNGPNSLDEAPMTDADITFNEYVVRVGNINDGNDYVEGGEGDDFIVTGKGNDLVFGGAGNDTVYSGAGNDIVVGGSGHDHLHTGADGDLVLGDGPNSLPAVRPTDVVNVRKALLRFSQQNRGNDLIWSGTGNDIVLAGQGNDGVHAGAGNDIVLGQAGDDALYGGDGDDIMLGGGGNDSMAGANGDDTMSGGVGNDWMFGDGFLPEDPRPMTAIDWALSDLSQQGRGNDVMHGGAGHDYMEGGAGDDRMVGGPHLRRDDPTDPRPVPVDPVVITTADFDGTLVDTDLVDAVRTEIDPHEIPPERPDVPDKDLIFGGSGNDRISSRTGDDIVVGGAGNDSIGSGAGNDLVLGDGPNSLAATPLPSTDRLAAHSYLSRVGNLNRGNDVIHTGGGADRVYAGRGNDVVDTGTGDDSAFGGAGNDRIFGRAGNDFLHGGAGNDFINGGSGNNTCIGGSGNDTIVCGDGADQIEGGAGDDVLDGGDGSDRIFGNDGDDELTGGDGEDYLEGGAGVDEFWAQDGFADVLCVEAGEAVHIDALIDEVNEC